MDARRLKRLTKLVRVQRQIQALHETRHSNHLASANAADREALELVERFDSGTSMSSLFPELYHQRISRAFATRDEQRDLAAQEARHIISATLRADKTDKARREMGKVLDEKTEERQRLDLAARGGSRSK
jgi:16S rRNA C967 or C1407 C5-methylase (RsmB/RsmF family)